MVSQRVRGCRAANRLIYTGYLSFCRCSSFIHLVLSPVQHPKARRYCAMMQAARRGASLFTATLHACRLQILTFSLSRAEPKIIRTLPRRREAKEQFANYIRLLATNPVPYRELHAATASGCTNGRRDIEPCRHTTEQCPAIYKQKIVLAT